MEQKINPCQNVRTKAKRFVHNAKMTPSRIWWKLWQNLAQIELDCTHLYMLQNSYNKITGENIQKCWINHRKQTYKSDDAKNVRRRTSFAHSCKICNGKKRGTLKMFAAAKCARKTERKLLHTKHILHLRPFGALKNAPQSVGNKQKWHKSGAAKRGSGFCAI